MTKRTVIQLFVIFLSVFRTDSFGQKQANIWYFGNHAGLDFNPGTPTPLLNGSLAFSNGDLHNEGMSAISDSSGSILFYSNGMTVWNRNHQVMQNGTGLLGNYSTTQSSIIVPDPSDPDRFFYLFTVSSGMCCGGDASDGLRYSKIDICLDSSRGAVITEEKNIKLVDSVAEKIDVTRHFNGTDYWILTHKFNSNEFWAMRLTVNGIIDTVISPVGAFHSGSLVRSQGQVKFSPNGQKIAISATNGLDLAEMFDFDKATGSVSNCQVLNRIDNGSVYSVEFSPDASKLYAVSWSFSPFGMHVSQYDLNAGNLAAINASLNSVYNETAIVTGRGLQRGPDGKIYMVSLSNNFTIAAIHNPNTYGIACNFQDQAVSLGGGEGSYSFPGFISGFNYSNGLSPCNPDNILEGEKAMSYSIYPNPFIQSAILEFDNPNSEICTLLLFDVQGKEVRRIRDISSGSVHIKGEGLPSGLYYFQLCGNDQVRASGKLILNRH